ncbi:MAG: class B sortase [Eubacteriales bacterium]
MSKNSAKLRATQGVSGKLPPPAEIEKIISEIKEAAEKDSTASVQQAALVVRTISPEEAPQENRLADELKRELDFVSVSEDKKSASETSEEKNRRLDLFFNKTLNELLNIKGEDISIHADEINYDIKTEAFNPFPLSLRKLDAADIPENERNRPRKKDSIDYLRYVILAVCASVFVYSGVNIISRLIHYSQARASYDEIRDMFYSDELDEEGLRTLSLAKPDKGSEEVLNVVGKDIVKTSAITSTKVDEFSYMKPRIEKLIAANPDVMGWIKVVGTRIDYPLVKGKDNDFYLTHNFKKEYDWVGSIFADFRVDKDLDKNRNTIFYGHNIQDGQMFRELLFFRDNPNMFYDSKIEIYTVKGIYVYEVFAFYKAKEDYKYIQTDFKDDDEWLAFLNEMQSNSYYTNRNVKLKKEDHIITLSTCTNINDEDRYSVQAVLVEIKNKVEE